MQRGSTPNPTFPLEVLVTDRQELFCRGLARLIDDVAWVRHTAWATTLPEAVRLARRLLPHLVLVDPKLDETGLHQVLGRLGNASRGAKMLVLEDAVREAHLRSALRDGVAGYWTKNCRPEEIFEGMRRIAAGEPAFCPSAMKYLVPTPEGYQFNALARVTRTARLTRRELEVAFHLAHGQTVREAAQRMRLSRSTVDNHKSRILKKLGLHKIVEVAVLLFREGIID